MPRTAPWPTNHGTHKRTETYRSGDVIRLNPGEGFTNVRLHDPLAVTRVELFTQRPTATGVDAAKQTLLSVTRSQFHDFFEAIPIIPQCGHDIDDRQLVFPFIEGLRALVVLYTLDDLGARQSFTVDIVSTNNISTKYHYTLLERTYLAINSEDFSLPLLLGGPATQLSVRLYSGEGAARADADETTKVFLVLGHKEIQLSSQQRPLWVVALDGTQSLAHVGAKLHLVSSCADTILRVDALRVEQLSRRCVRFCEGYVTFA